PVDDHPHFAVETGDAGEVVRAVHEPGRPALDLDSIHLCDAFVQAETGHRADVLVPVVDRLATTEHGDEIVGEPGRLAYGVLPARPGHRARLGQVRYRRAVPGRPGTRDHLPVRTHHLERRPAGDPPLLVHRQVGVAQDRVRLHTGGPDDGVGL